MISSFQTCIVISWGKKLNTYSQTSATSISESPGGNNQEICIFEQVTSTMSLKSLAQIKELTGNDRLISSFHKVKLGSKGVKKFSPKSLLMD